MRKTLAGLFEFDITLVKTALISGNIVNSLQLSIIQYPQVMLKNVGHL